MLLPIFFLLLDFISFAFFNQWILYSLCVYCISLIILPGKIVEKKFLIPVFFMVLIQDFVVYGRFGLLLGFIVPMILLTSALKDILLHAQWSLMTMWTISIFLFNDIFLKIIVFSAPIEPLVTIMKILINLIIGYGILWGKRGNRSLIT